MNNRIRTMILAAAVVTAFAAPALADTAVCTVKAPEIRIRKSPSKKAHVVGVLKKDTRITTVGACAGGWVKVTSEDGLLSGYVAGWAISDAAPKIAAAAVIPPKTEVAKAEPVPSVTTQKEIPSNEKLAIQITELRLNVLGVERDVAMMNKEIQKIKATIRHKATSKKVAAHVSKGHRHQAKKG
jgi:uncharacterized small protein (DUF1192 family)